MVYESSSSRTMVLPATAVNRQRKKSSCLCRMSNVRRVACLLAAGTCLLQVVSLLARPVFADQTPQQQQQPTNHLQNHLSSLRAPSAIAKSTSQLEHNQQQQIDQTQQLNSISQTVSNGPISGLQATSNSIANDISQLLIGGASASQLANLGDLSSMSGSSSAAAAVARSRSPRSIGEMFKKIFNGNKRSKNSPAQGSREWDQQQSANQQHQQQQQLQQQQNQAANMASMMAAAANQHAVYASPFATYSPQSSASAFYPQFSPYSSAGLVAWPQLAHSLRAPTLIGPASTAVGPLYAAASQSYNSYTAPPSSSAAAAAAGQPQAAASHQHASSVPAPPGLVASPHPGSSGPSSLDFHQVLDALVRTSGFAPAGDQEAAAASGYGSKTDGTPVFSFKKLVSLPFYLSTEEKSLDGLANAVGPAGGAGGYSLHSMPIMRRHVRRMSTPNQTPAAASSQQQFTNQIAALQAATDKSEQMQRSERAQQEKYSNYLNAINNQIASLTANNQLLQYLSARQPQQQQQQSADAYATETAIANYQALLSAANAGFAGPSLQKSIASPAINQQSSITTSATRQPATSVAASGATNQMIAAASMVQPIAIQAPQNFIQQHQKQQQLEQDRDFTNLLNSFQQQQQQQLSLDPFSSAFPTTNQQIHSYSTQDGHRFGQANQQQTAAYYPQQNYYGQFPQSDSSGFLTTSSGFTNNNGQEAYLATNAQSQQMAGTGVVQQQQVHSQNNAPSNHHHQHHQHHHSHNQQHEQQSNQMTPGSPSSSSSAAAQSLGDVVVGSPSSAVLSAGQQQSQQVALGAAGSSQSQSSSGNTQASQQQQIENQQQQQQQQQQK